MTDKLLEVTDLRTHFYYQEGTVKALEAVTFTVDRQRTLGLVGESGCGKSVTAQSILQILGPKGKIVGGRIIWHRDQSQEIDLATLAPTGQEIRRIRGKEIAMIFQEPMTSLSPVYTIGNQIMEAILLHQDVTRHEARGLAAEMLAKVGIPRPDQQLDEYPHQLSGGMRQRAMIAMALSCYPRLLIAEIGRAHV